LPRDRISKRSVDSLFCPEGKDREFLWDDALAGFGVAAFASGKKVYVAQYRKDGRSRRVSLCEHGRLTPDEARSMAKTVLGQVEQGSDPVEERRKARAVRTFREVAEDFIKLHVAQKRKGGTKADYEALLNRFIYPAIGSKRIVDVRRSEVTKLHAKLAEKPYTGNRVLALISSIWNWAAKRDEVEFTNNPAKGIERNEEKKRERFLTSDELGRLGETLRLAETVGLEWTIDKSKPKAKHAPKSNRRTKIDPHAAAAIRLLILTGARLREVLHARWEHVDFERSIIHLPDSKTGAKPIYLSAAALDILRELPRVDGNPHVIPGEKDGAPRADLKKPWSAVTKAASIEGTRIHDLRHSFASVGAGASLGLPIIGKLLGHSQAATTHRYAHLDADPMHKAVNTIGETLSAAMKGRRRSTSTC
jgi:integrase